MVALDIAFAAIVSCRSASMGSPSPTSCPAWNTSSTAPSRCIGGSPCRSDRSPPPWNIALASLLAGTAAAITLASLPEAVDLVMRLLRLAVPGVVGLVVRLAALAALRI